MWKYIVMWTLIEMIPGSPAPMVDEYGITSNCINAICVWSKHETNHRKEFFDRSKAVEFIKNAPVDDGAYSVIKSYCDFAPLDSVWIGQFMERSE